MGVKNKKANECGESRGREICGVKESHDKVKDKEKKKGKSWKQKRGLGEGWGRCFSPCFGFVSTTFSFSSLLSVLLSTFTAQQISTQINSNGLLELEITKDFGYDSVYNLYPLYGSQSTSPAYLFSLVINKYFGNILKYTFSVLI